MLNQVVLVGRIVGDVEVEELEKGRRVANLTLLTLAVNRSYKNAEGIYETDFINCRIWDNIATNVKEYCQKGDIVGVKGRLQTNNFEKEDGTKGSKIEVIAEKVTFLSSRRTDDEE